MSPDAKSLVPAEGELVTNPGPLLQRYFLVVVNDSTGSVSCVALEKEESLVERLKECQGPGVHTFQFVGQRLFTTKPPLRHLVVADRKIPLDNLEPSEELDDSGSLEPTATGEDPGYAALSAQLLADNAAAFPDVVAADVQDAEFEPAVKVGPQPADDDDDK